MKTYRFPHTDFDIDYMIKSGRVIYFIFDGDYTEVTVHGNADDWFYD